MARKQVRHTKERKGAQQGRAIPRDYLTVKLLRPGEDGQMAIRGGKRKAEGR